MAGLWRIIVALVILGAAVVAVSVQGNVNHQWGLPLEGVEDRAAFTWAITSRTDGGFFFVVTRVCQPSLRIPRVVR